MKTIIENSGEIYTQKCENLRSTGWKGFWISGIVLVAFLAFFYFVGEAMADKDRKSIVNMKSSQEYIAAKQSAKGRGTFL